MYFLAVQAQEMFSEATDVNFLASGANNPSIGSGGSGIYEGRSGPKVEGIVAGGGNRVFVAQVGSDDSNDIPEKRDVDADAKDLDGFRLKRDNIGGYTTMLLVLETSRVQQRLCHEMDDDKGEFCCDFDVKLVVDDGVEELEEYYTYRMAAYSGVRSFSGKFIQNCVSNLKTRYLKKTSD